MNNFRDVHHFVPSNAPSFRGSPEASVDMLYSHLANMQIFALNTLANTENFSNRNVAMAARSRLTRTVAEMLDIYDIHKSMTDQPKFKVVVEKVVLATAKEPGMMGVGQWFAKVMGNVRPDIAPILGRIATGTILSRRSPSALTTVEAVGSFTRGVATELPNLSVYEVGNAYRGAMLYLRTNQMRNPGNATGEGFKNYANWLAERVTETNYPNEMLFEFGRIDREVDEAVFGN